MAKYRKKPIVVEAIQWTTENYVEVAEFMNVLTFETASGNAFIPTLEGTMTASPADWIIKGVAGECYPCKPDIFAETYEAVTETAPAQTDYRLPKKERIDFGTTETA